MGKWTRLFASFRELRQKDKDVHAGIRFFDAMSAILGRGEATMIASMRASEHGRSVLAEGASLFSVVTNRSRLRGLPEGTLGREYVRFADEREIYPEQFEQLLEEALGRPSELTDHGSALGRLVHDRYRHLHDVWHVLLGYDTDEEGELSILAFTGRQNGYRAHYMAAGVQSIAAGFRGDFSKLRAFRRGWTRSKAAECLIAQDWDALFVLPLETVRETLAIPPLSEPAVASASGPLGVGAGG
jgi:ubiquinone biosynthesis protein COQ4